MNRERAGLRLRPVDNEAIATVAAALPRADFATLTTTVHAALAAAAHLARTGILMDVLAEAEAARRAR